MNKKLVIIGASGHGKVVADVALLNGYERVEFLDDACVAACAGFPVVGKVSDVPLMEECDFFVAIGNPTARERIFSELELLGNSIATLVHPNAVVSRRVEIGAGSVVMAGAVINSDTRIGKGCIVNTSASVDHDCAVGDFVHVSVGAHVAGAVQVGDRTWIGIGSAVSNNLSICEDCMIGAGTVVVKGIVAPDTYVGVPAHPMNGVFSEKGRGGVGLLAKRADFASLAA